MKEAIDEDLIKQWESTLKAEGMPDPEHKPKEEVPLEALESQPQQEAIDRSMISREDLAQFSLLPRKLQRDIIDDVYNQKNTGIRVPDLVARIRLFITKGHELVKMENEATDVTYQPPESNEVPALNHEEHIRRIQQIIDQLEEAFEKEKIIH